VSFRTTLFFLTIFAAAPAFALDWGGSLENSTGANLTATTVVNQSETGRFWVQQAFGRSANLTLKASVYHSVTLDPTASGPSGAVSFDLDALVFTGGGLKVGRTIYRDFSSTLLNTVLDGIEYDLSVPGFDLTVLAGTSKYVFQDQSTIAISQADLNDRIAGQKIQWSDPSTYLAPPRAVAYVEGDLTRLAKDLTLKLALAGQYDLRSSAADSSGAPVSMAYAGLGGSGRLVGPFYWDLWAYGGAGKSQTQVPVPGAKTVSKTWADSTILNAIANLDLTLLLPDWNNSVVNLGVMGGSWDPDGTTPSQNAPSGNSPSQYTGYFGISRTGSALIFNPQPTNLVLTQVLYSFKPFARDTGGLGSIQVAASGFAFVRPTSGAITESGVDPNKSDLYLASEGDLNLLFRPASDWGGNLGLGILVPGAAMTRKIETKVQLGLNLSF
jgi:hypothetical protein